LKSGTEVKGAKRGMNWNRTASEPPPHGKNKQLGTQINLTEEGKNKRKMKNKKQRGGHKRSGGGGHTTGMGQKWP